MTLPTEDTARKAIPIYSGFMMYFPDAIAAVAEVSRIGNEQHNPGEPLHWARGKSMNQHDTLARHLMQAGEIDSDGVRHSAKVAWRALAALQLEIEAAEAEGPVVAPDEVVSIEERYPHFKRAAEARARIKTEHPEWRNDAGIG